ncbi:hypothetical protein DFH08DRAFT_396294 [Mycena albidolilacea]|uniref:Uncharacterized protein n=1 Tax=Mycena albidolilacea TaxID=1033008 RepID=A0AAD6ZDM6_9AGAR|nr:hypothetical protein DFH08DRAFT_396294 [Mycena albidolilacea]
MRGREVMHMPAAPSARGLLPPSPSMLWRVRVRAQARFPMYEANGACVWTSDAHACGVVRAGRPPRIVLLVLSLSMCVMRCWSVGDVDSVCELMNFDARAGAGDKVRRKNTVRSSKARAMPMPMHTRGTASSGTGPAASSDLSPQVPVLLQEVTVPHSRIATSVLVWVGNSVLAVSMLRAGSTPSAGDGRGRGEGTGMGARADSVSSAGGLGRDKVVGRARERKA